MAVGEGRYDITGGRCDVSASLSPAAMVRVGGRTGASREKSLQVDELVHQHQGACQAGQAGLGAATVTTRVAS